MEHVQQRILKTESVIVAQESIGGKGTRNSEALVPFFEKEVIGQTYIETGGELYLCSAGFDSKVVTADAYHLKGQTRTTKGHGGSPVLQSDTELQLVELTRDILDTSVDGETRSRHVVGALGNDLHIDTAMNTTGETMGISHIDIHIARRKGTVSTQLRAIIFRNINVTEAHRHDIDTKDTGIENTNTETEGVDCSATGEAIATAIKHGVRITHFDIVEESEACHIIEHSVDTTYIGDVNSTPTSATSPGIDKQFRGAGRSTALIIASLRGRGSKRRENHNYSKYF